MDALTGRPNVWRASRGRKYIELEAVSKVFVSVQLAKQGVSHLSTRARQSESDTVDLALS